MKRFAFALLVVLAAACTGKRPGVHPDAVRLTLAPDLISSQDGTTHITATVLQAGAPLVGFDVALTIDYVDRNSVIRPIAGTTQKTGKTGSFEFIATGLKWQGAGTVHAAVLDGAGQPLRGPGGAPIVADASFSVLDLTPPVVTILPPTSDLKIGPGLPLEIQVSASDEIGVSQIVVQLAGEATGQGTQLIASGTTSGLGTFEFSVPDTALSGPNITVYAMASDLSGNLTAAAPVILTVDPAITVATIPGFVAATIATGSNTFLSDPRAIALSPKDGQLYVADNSGGTPCNGACVRKVDPATGAAAAGAVATGVGTITGISFDATGDNLYYSDFQNRLIRLTYNGTDYATPTTCNVPANQLPNQPMHSVFDATLGLLVADQNTPGVMRQATCTGVDPTVFSGTAFDTPVGMGLGTAGELYVSDLALNRIFQLDRSTGAATAFETFGLQEPQGIEWMSGGASPFNASLFVANSGMRRITSTRGNGTPRSLVFFSDTPVDLTGAAGTIWVVTRPGNGPGRIYKVTGF